MLLSQKLAGFTKGQADSLRKAMGKKKIEEMNKLFDLFISQGTEKGHKEEILKKVWKDWGGRLHPTPSIRATVRVMLI